MADKRTQIETVIQTAIDSTLKEVHTCLPAIVSRVDHATQLIDAQITIKRKIAGELVNLPLLVDVPIRFPRSQTFSITFPIEINDHVLILFSERSIDTWLTEGGIQNPFDVRKFSLSDAFALPMMYPQNDLIPGFNADNLEIKTNSGDTKISVRSDENIDLITTGDVNIICSDLDVDADSVTINADSVDITATDVSITAETSITGNLSVSGTISAPTVTAATSLAVAGKEMSGHTHAQGVDSNGDTQQNTGGPV